MARIQRSILSALILLLVLVVPAQAWDLHQVEQFGTPGYESARDVTAVDGATFVAGNVAGPLDGEQTASGGLDSWVRSYDADGAQRWTDQYGTATDDVASGIVAHAGGVVTVGRTGGDLASDDDDAGSLDVFVRRYHANGTVDWTRQIGTPAVEIAFHHPVATDGEAIYVAGQTLGSFADHSAAAGAITFVAKLDGDGDTDWIEQFGTRGAVSLLGGIAADDSGGVLATARSGAASIRGFDLQSGDQRWEHEDIGGTGNCAATYWDVAIHDGIAYAAGQWADAFATDRDGCDPSAFSTVVGVVHAYATDGGQLEWQRIIKGGTREGNEGFTGAKWVDASAAGLYVGANLSADLPGHVPTARPDRRDCPGLNTGNAFVDRLDAYVRRYTLDGDVVWTRQFGSTAFDLAQGAAPTAGDVTVVGDTSCRLDATQAYAGGSRDVFVAQLNQQPRSIPGRINLVIGDLETLSDADVLDAGTFDSLVQQLEAALVANSNDHASAVRRSLAAFVRHVDALEADGTLSAGQAARLIDAATRVSQVL